MLIGQIQSFLSCRVTIRCRLNWDVYDEKREETDSEGVFDQLDLILQPPIRRAPRISSMFSKSISESGSGRIGEDLANPGASLANRGVVDDNRGERR